MRIVQVLAMILLGCTAFLGGLVLISGESLLTVAVTTRNPLFVKAVLPFSNPDEVTEDQYPAIVVGAHSGHDVIVGILLDAEVNPNVVGPDGASALSVAVKKGHDFVARKLIARGGDPNLGDQYNRTPLSYAAELGRDSLARDLIHNQADVDLADIQGNPPLYYSIVTGNHGITRDLVEMEAKVNLLNHRGETPMHAAWNTWRNSDGISKNLERISISYLLEKGLNPSTPNKMNRSLKNELDQTPYANLLSGK
tara:strand:- start:67 stop:825 length:759 start_codon:yes stop_codon:yes gene_type:complete